MRAGDVVYHFCTNTIPDPKWKYIVCIHANAGQFLWINSKQRKTKPGSNIPMSPKELDCLERPSFICTSIIVPLDPEEIQCDSTGRPHDLRGRLSDELKRRVVDSLEASRYLNENEKELIRQNLTPDDD